MLCNDSVGFDDENGTLNCFAFNGLMKNLFVELSCIDEYWDGGIHY